MTDFIPFALPDLGAEEIAEVVSVLESGWITTGPRSKEFEQRFGEAVGAKHAVAVSSCTAALHLALEAVGVGPGDEVVVPVLTFSSTAGVVHHLGATPVLADVDPEDHTLPPHAVEKVLTPRTRAVLPVDFAGQPARLEPLLELARTRNGFLVEDAAHAFPASCGNRSVGSVADITCFSFYATKTITTGEGGMATTDRPDWAARMRMMSLLGISKDAWKRYSAEGSWYYEVLEAGFKYNLTDLAAALGLVQLRRAEEMRRRRQQIAEAYMEAFSSSEAIELLTLRPDCQHAWHLFVVKLRPELLRIDRNRFIEELKRRGIGTSVHFIPLHLHPFYREALGHEPEDFPVALDCYRRSISLPIYSKMTGDHVQAVIEAVTAVAAEFRR